MVALPPLDGSLETLIDLLDFHVKHNATEPFAKFPAADDPTRVASISFAEMAQASHVVASRLLGSPGHADGEVVAVLLHTDSVIYDAVLLGAFRAGLVVYPMSPRNSVQAVCNMLQTTGCRRIITNPPLAALTEAIAKEFSAKGEDIRFDPIPSLQEIFPKYAGVEEPSPFPHVPNPPKKPSGPAMYLHSSGSTGLPKSVPLSQKRVWQWATRPFAYGARLRGVRFGTMGLPMFHALGFFAEVCSPLVLGQPVSVYTPRSPAPPPPPSPQTIYEVAKLTGCTGMYAVPSFVDAWSRSDEIVEFLKTLQVLVSSGGPLPHEVALKMLNNGVRVFSGYGGTEIGDPMKSWDETPGSLAPLEIRTDFNYMEVSRDRDVKFEPQGDGTYELVVYESDEVELPVHNVPGEKAYATGDLWVPHSTKPGLWQIVGRKDDVIALTTGEKIVPIPQEGHIGGDPLVSGCVMFGREREQPGLIIEPKAPFDPADSAALVDFRNKIWPRVQEANKLAPAFAKIFKEMIIVTDPAKPFPRAGKGSIIRKQALALYEDAINNLYTTVAESSQIGDIDPPTGWTEDDLRTWLLSQATSLNNGIAPIPDMSLFDQGFDSLSSTFLRNRIIGTLRSSAIPNAVQTTSLISPNFVFDNPTIAKLASALALLADPIPGVPNNVAGTGVAVEEINSLVAKYSQDITHRSAHSEGAHGAERVVLLTGATGNVGSHILASLLSDARVARVYTLVRPSSQLPEERLRAAFVERLLPEELLSSSKLVHLVGDVTKKTLGIDESTYKEVLESITHVVHNAWTVNFNLSLEVYEGQIAGVRAIVDLCASSPRPIHLLLTSSIAVAGGWDPANGPVPEAAALAPELATSSGYAASKYVAEKVLEAASRYGLRTMTVRLGQACGSKATGAWSTSEWFPILVKSSVALGIIPELRGPVDWVPLDAIAKTYVDWVTANHDLPARVNLVHPRPTTWEAVLTGRAAALRDRLPLKPITEWVAELERLSANATVQTLNTIPALKLLPFFRSLALRHTGPKLNGQMTVTFDTAQLQASSPTMNTLEPLSEDHSRAWMKYWESKKFIVWGDRD